MASVWYFDGSVGSVSDVQTEVNRLFDNFFGRPASAAAGRAWDKDVTVSITGDLLSVKGERRFEHDVKEQQFLHVERVYGKFEQLVQLPIPVQA